MPVTVIIHKLVPVNHVDPRECRLYKLEVAGRCTQHHGDMVEVWVCDQALELARELRGLEKEYIACVRYLLEVVLVDTRIFPEVSSDWDINLHFTEWSGGRDYLQEIWIANIVGILNLWVVFWAFMLYVSVIYLKVWR